MSNHFNKKGIITFIISKSCFRVTGKGRYCFSIIGKGRCHFTHLNLMHRIQFMHSVLLAVLSVILGYLFLRTRIISMHFILALILDTDSQKLLRSVESDILLVP